MSNAVAMIAACMRHQPQVPMPWSLDLVCHACGRPILSGHHVLVGPYVWHHACYAPD